MAAPGAAPRWRLPRKGLRGAVHGPRDDPWARHCVANLFLAVVGCFQSLWWMGEFLRRFFMIFCRLLFFSKFNIFRNKFQSGIPSESNSLDQVNGSTFCQAWPRGYKTLFMLNSSEHEIYPADKC